MPGATLQAEHTACSAGTHGTGALREPLDEIQVESIAEADWLRTSSDFQDFLQSLLQADPLEIPA